MYLSVQGLILSSEIFISLLIYFCDTMLYISLALAVLLNDRYFVTDVTASRFF